MTQNEPRVRVGTSGWKKPMWRGYFYRRGLVQNRELQYASSRLSSLEINTTFHGLARPSSYQSWRSETPDDFVFAVKGNKAVTHDHRLRNPADDVADFLASGLFELGEKLGPILWQTPPSLPFHHDTVEAFLATLPHSADETRRLIARRGGDQLALDIPDRPIRHALEVRHPSFANPTFIEMLRRYDVAAVATNTLEWPEIYDVTSDFVYVRLHGSANHYPDGYDDTTLDHWAALVNGWLSGESCPDNHGRDVFVYFDNPDNEGVNSPFDAMHLLERLGAPSYEASPADQLPLWDDEELLQQESHLTTMPGGLVPQTARFQGVSDLGRTLVKNRERVIELAGNAGAKNIRVFGSVAKGSDKTGSDVDLLADISEGTSLLMLSRLERDLGQLLGCTVDVIPAEGLRTHLVKQVLETAVPL